VAFRSSRIWLGEARTATRRSALRGAPPPSRLDSRWGSIRSAAWQWAEEVGPPCRRGMRDGKRVELARVETDVQQVLSALVCL